MTSRRHFAIVFEPASARSVSRYVVRGFFSPRGFPQAFARMVLTREFGLFVTLPMTLLITARFVPESLSLILTGAAVVWLVAGLLRISRYGPSSGIGCYDLGPDNMRGKLNGALRMRLDRNGKRLWIAGLLVEPSCRGNGIGTALILAAFRLAKIEAAHGPVTVSVFAPTHPASKAIIEKHLEGLQTVQVTEPPSEIVSRTLERLEMAVQNSPSAFEWWLSDTDEGLF